MRGKRAKMLRRIANGDRRLYKNLKRTYKIMYRSGLQISGVQNDHDKTNEEP